MEPLQQCWFAPGRSFLRIGFSRYLAEDFDAALAQCEKAVRMDPAFIYARTSLAAVYSQAGKADAAINMAAAARALPDGDIPSVIGELGYAHARAGHTEEAEALLQALVLRKASGIFVDPWCLAVIQAGLGQTEHALESIQQAIEEKSTTVFWLNVEPKFKGLRKEARFQQLWRKVGPEKSDLSR
jgi:tetratricopeptide (TPR) repeat protein